MKKLFICCTLVFLGLGKLSAQDLDKIVNQYRGFKLTDTILPLTSGAFDRFLTDHFSYTILGSLSPATGLKVETATPSISLKGTVAKNKRNTFFSTLELQAGADGNLFQVFSSDKMSTYFKATGGFYRLLGRVKVAKLKIVNKASYRQNNKYLNFFWRDTAIVKYKELVKHEQKTKILSALLSEKFMDNPSITNLLMLIVEKDHSESLPPSRLPWLPLLKECLKEYGMDTVKADVTNIDVLLGYFRESGRLIRI